MSRPVLLLLRHGATEWSVESRLTSRTDLALSEEGRSEAARCGVRLEAMLGSKVTVVRSPRRRAAETAALALPNHVARVDELLDEADFGSLEGLTLAEVAEKQADWRYWFDGCEGGEPLSAVERRAGDALRMLANEESDVAVAVAHGVILKAMICVAGGRPLEHGQSFQLPTCSVSVITPREDGDRFHVEAVGLTEPSETAAIADKLGLKRTPRITVGAPSTTEGNLR